MLIEIKNKAPRNGVYIQVGRNPMDDTATRID